MLLVGVDENGMGPRLGPLVATAVTVELGQGYDRARLRRLGLRAGIHDSKQTSAFGRMAHAEALSLAVLEHLTGSVPQDADQLLGQLALDGLLGLRAPCPSGNSAAQCWGPLKLPAFGGDVQDGRRLVARLGRWGVQMRRARSAIACAGVLNADFAAEVSKLVVDLSLFERLLLDARRAEGHEISAVCGMVGGMRRYPEYFRHFSTQSVDVLQETKGRSGYHVQGVGEVAFEIDADDRHLPVALASMLGKYVRELCMERQNRFYTAHDASLPKPSGYHDPVTARFIRKSGPLRRRLQVASECFVRAR